MRLTFLFKTKEDGALVKRTAYCNSLLIRIIHLRERTMDFTIINHFLFKVDLGKDENSLWIRKIIIIFCFKVDSGENSLSFIWENPASGL